MAAAVNPEALSIAAELQGLLEESSREALDIDAPEICSRSMQNAHPRTNAAALRIVSNRPERPQTLVEIMDHLSVLFDTLERITDGDQEPDDSTEAEIRAFLEMEIRKVDNVADYLAFCEAQATFAAAEIDRLQTRKRSWEKKQELLETYVTAAIVRSGRPKLEGRSNTLQLRKCPPSVEIIDAAIVPETYTRITVTESIDKTAAKADLKAGIEIPGLRLITDRKRLERK